MLKAPQMPNRSILIIGAGIGGLSAGCFALMNGYRVRILEMHTRPGGQCTAWTRHGYTFDGCIHNLAGTVPGSDLHEMWRELGIVPKIGFYAYDELVRVERTDGPPLMVFTNLDRLSAHLKELSPSDGQIIDELIAGARRFTSFDLLGLAVATPFQRLRSLAHVPGLMKYAGVSLSQFAKRFQNQFLAQAFPSLVYDWPDTPLLLLMSFLGRMHVGDFGWAKGGSAKFAEAIAERFESLGGEIQYHAKVDTVIVEGGRAVGVRLCDGTEERADVIISNANGHDTIFHMLGGRYASSNTRAYYDQPEDRIEMGIHVSLGVNRDLSGEAHAILLPLKEPVEIAGELRSRLYVEPFGFDATLAPRGKSVLKVILATSFRQWESLADDPERYNAEKHRIAEAVIGVLEPRFPGIKGQVEVVDVATPITTKKFTANGHGYKAPLSRLMRSLFMHRSLSQTLPGLANFYMVGQWAGSPGVPLVAAMGRDVAQAICRHDSVAFQRRSVTPAQRSYQPDAVTIAR
jgi:phytoene dehydrogenase-like protein